VDFKNLKFQLGSGCLVDQMVGQYMAHVCGLGYLLKKSNVRKALKSVYKYNRQENMFGHLNYRNSFVMNDESAMLIAVYPRGDRPKWPVPGQGDVMTGFEYAAAVGMLQEGQVKQGLQCIRDIRNRYDGKRRSPFNEAECGHHYGRAMASWAAVTTLTGFQYSGVTGTLTFAATDEASTFFWSNGYAWGTLTQKPGKASTRVELKVLHGSLKLKTLELTGKGTFELPRMRTLGAGKALECKI
jgi:non-lysosomal glucosylceramidase